MKGYVILTLAVSLILLSMPPLVLHSGQATDESTAVDEGIVSVLHADRVTQSRLSLYDLTVYETAAQMSADAPTEALKAQAIACYTLFCYQRLTKEEGAADIGSTVLSFPEGYTEAYWREQWGESYDANMAIYRDAVSAVFGKQLLHDGQPIMAVSHTMNAGKTENATVLWEEDIPYLRAVASPADALRTDLLATVSIPVADATAKLTELLGTAPTQDSSAWFGDIQKTQAGTVTSVSICAKPFGGKQVQEAFALPSAAFSVSVQGENVIFTVQGQGHFVGLSSVGAAAMAQSGQSCEEILHHYYTGVSIA